MVEKELRHSRWELGTEASGVLRKLLRTTDVGSVSTSSFPSIPRELAPEVKPEPETADH